MYKISNFIFKNLSIFHTIKPYIFDNVIFYTIYNIYIFRIKNVFCVLITSVELREGLESNAKFPVGITEVKYRIHPNHTAFEHLNQGKCDFTIEVVRKFIVYSMFVSSFFIHCLFVVRTVIVYSFIVHCTFIYCLCAVRMFNVYSLFVRFTIVYSGFVR